MTIKYTPAQLLYDATFTALKGLGIEVIDSKDITNKIPYPFFVVGQFKTIKTEYTFNSYHGTFNGTIDVWSNDNDLGEHNLCVNYAETILSEITEIEDYQIRYKEITTNTIIDYSTDIELLHTIINIEYEVL
ncbi:MULTISPECIES: hypothetical protein [Staphylococcus]|uniref:DUF3168 domain-containing protein n=1 Tax=Staphylococcus haemolyticus TaxID=1283 RepID=A0AB38PG08_STAHA|nr:MULTISPECIES: hypothetical protein [Staphylococcus]MCE4992070.1 hypothetical protein [Staphylococcus haemolyticus]PTK53123.1 hypothetical protein BUZ37_09585 [Staphylococcus haemolyticus]TRL79239.1 hypothetical protein FNL11_01900 [Staphylococcus haemolyticus]